MDKFKNKYRIPSARLQNWDYGSNGAYFITICTQNREHFFGEIVDGKMQLNELGQLAEKYWLEIPDHFPFIELGNFVIMPNHTHGILILDSDSDTGSDTGSNCRDAINRVSTIGTTADNTTTGGVTGNKNPMLHQNISRIIRWYKGRCSFEMRKIHADFAWQSRFHDHIIRDTPSFKRIQTYIDNNPMNWNKDKFYENNN
ncbi:MAG TPA: transposase [Taishania sp.]|nr:transposase [Taishania sp.]